MDMLLYRLNMCIADDDYMQRIVILKELIEKASWKIKFYEMVMAEQGETKCSNE